MGEKIYNPNVLTPDEIIARLPTAFEQGVKGELFFYESTMTTYIENGVEYEIRKCPALRDKPIPNSSATLSQARRDPFEPPYSKDLLVGELQGEDNSKYIILLNKYSIFKHHFLLITKELVPQATPPTPEDLTAVYSLITAAYRAGTSFFAFFNCGEKSGASQFHKHLQLAPVLSSDGPPLEALARKENLETESKPFPLRNVPWAHFVRRFPPHLSAHSTPKEDVYETLGQVFMSLLDLAITAIRYDKENEHEPGAPHYNLIVTRSHMHIVPRSREKYVFSDSGDTISVNAVGFAGHLLVKSDTESEAVIEEGVQNILRTVAVPRIDDELDQSCEY